MTAKEKADKIRVLASVINNSVSFQHVVKDPLKLSKSLKGAKESRANVETT